MRANPSAYRTEHALAWFMAVMAIVLAAVGLLEAFDNIDIGDAQLSAVAPTGNVQSEADLFADGALWLIPAIVAAILAMMLHASEHHIRDYRLDGVRLTSTTGSGGSPVERERALWDLEHVGSYIAALLAVLLAVLGLLVGFGVLDDGHTFYDGLSLQLAAVASAILAATLHTVDHHQPIAERDMGT